MVITTITSPMASSHCPSPPPFTWCSSQTKGQVRQGLLAKYLSNRAQARLQLQDHEVSTTMPSLLWCSSTFGYPLIYSFGILSSRTSKWSQPSKAAADDCSRALRHDGNNIKAIIRRGLVRPSLQTECFMTFTIVMMKIMMTLECVYLLSRPITHWAS